MATRADQRKFHYIYKITREDGKYYIGMHSTNDLDDGYFGSGKLLWFSIRKHGKEKHTKEIVEFLPTRLELKQREQSLVNEEILNDPLCMNLKLGGEGGGGLWSKEHAEKWANARLIAARNGGINLQVNMTTEERSRRSKLAAGTKRNRNTPGSFRGKQHSEETKQKMRKPRNQGDKNSQFGTCWITNGNLPRKIKKCDLDLYISLGYRVGRK